MNIVLWACAVFCGSWWAVLCLPDEYAKRAAYLGLSIVLTLAAALVTGYVA